MELAALRLVSGAAAGHAVGPNPAPPSRIRVPRLLWGDADAACIIMEDAGSIGLVSLTDALTQVGRMGEGRGPRGGNRCNQA